nr:MAG TPA: Hepatitis core protein, putative zinc finger [Caudoviricetes sp.]
MLHIIPCLCAVCQANNRCLPLIPISTRFPISALLNKR